MAKILIVEDDPFLQKMYKKKFTLEGYEVESASDGANGLSKIKSFTPDLVLLDIMLPKMNGIEVIEKAKADPEIKHIPIIVLSNLSTTDDADAAIKKGSAGYLIKSEYTPSQVVAKVQAFLHSRK